MTPCKACKTPTSDLSLFPGGICLDCYKQTAEARRMPTAAEIRRTWGVTR